MCSKKKKKGCADSKHPGLSWKLLCPPFTSQLLMFSSLFFKPQCILQPTWDICCGSWRCIVGQARETGAGAFTLPVKSDIQSDNHRFKAFDAHGEEIRIQTLMEHLLNKTSTICWKFRHLSCLQLLLQSDVKVENVSWREVCSSDSRPDQSTWGQKWFSALTALPEMISLCGSAAFCSDQIMMPLNFTSSPEHFSTFERKALY